MSNIRKIDPADPDPDLIREAAGIIRGGGVVVFPTLGLYGLAADAFRETALKKIFDIKQRPDHKPVLVMIDSTGDIGRLVVHIPPVGKALMARFWPGRLTIVFAAAHGLPTMLTAGSGKIGVRLPGHPVSAALVKASNRPVTGTSANISGDGGCVRIADMDARVIDMADLVLDAGELEGGVGSTVIDVTVDPANILREGALSAKEILGLLYPERVTF